MVIERNGQKILLSDMEVATAYNEWELHMAKQAVEDYLSQSPDAPQDNEPDLSASEIEDAAYSVIEYVDADEESGERYSQAVANAVAEVLQNRNAG